MTVSCYHATRKAPAGLERENGLQVGCLPGDTRTIYKYREAVPIYIFITKNQINNMHIVPMHMRPLDLWNNFLNFKSLYLLTIFNKFEIKWFVQFSSLETHFYWDSSFLLFWGTLGWICQNSNYFSQKNALKANFYVRFCCFPKCYKSTFYGRISEKLKQK